MQTIEKGGYTACPYESVMLNLVKVEPSNLLLARAPPDPGIFKMSRQVSLRRSPSENRRATGDRTAEWRWKRIDSGEPEQDLEGSREG
jgi:hypothetical protein